MTHILHPAGREELEIGAPIVVRIFRFNPATDAEPYYQEYTVPYKHRMSAFTLLREIYEHQDPTLAFRNQQCGRGLCGICHMRIAGKVVKSCTVPLEPGSRLTIMPYNTEKVIRDLVVS